jgi:hypothetical protein
MACLALLFSSGCADLKATLALRPQIAVKVPGDETQIPESREATVDGWKFVHLAAVQYETRRGKVITNDAPAQWYLAVPTDRKKYKNLSWWSVSRLYAKARVRLPEIAEAVKKQFGIYPTTLEVVNIFDASKSAGPGTTNRDLPAIPQGDFVQLQRGAKSRVSWPVGKLNGADDPLWHLRTAYSQLEDARARVTTNHAREPWRVRVGIIDTGFSGANVGTPKFLDEDEKLGDAWNMLSCLIWDGDTNKCKPLKPSDTEGSHGTGTIGILAGRNVKIPPDKNGHGGYEGPLGGVPDATIVPVRVAPWVVSLNTANFAYALDYASRVKKCDVISMSHGGAPSMLWYDTINSAYYRGTAMVAASGDFFSYGLLRRAIIPPPSSPIYPAGARRVLSVTGVTADGNNYAAPTLGGFLNGLVHFKLFDSAMRGSYGADGSWRNIFWSDEKGDTVASKRQGDYRIYPIAAPVPNVPWLVSASEAHGKTNVVDLNGGGTSGATPQVAAAAALWLEYYKDQWTNLPKEDRWKKAEAVYQALLRTAERSEKMKWPDRYLGAGMLKANRALDFSFNDIVKAGDNTGFAHFQRSPRDFFDGAKSFNAIVGRMEGNIEEDATVTEKLKNTLKDPPGANTTQIDALFRCFYNTRMLEDWHRGSNPDAETRARFEKEAWQDAWKN